MKKLLFFAAILLFALQTNAQSPITINVPGSNSGGSSSGSGNGYCFSVRNNNSGPIAVTDISCYHYASPTGAGQYSLWYTMDPSQNTGTSGITVNPSTWTNVVSGAIVSGSNGIKPFFTGLYIMIPAGAICRFAVTFPYTYGSSTIFIGSNTASGTIFSSGGVDVLTGANGVSNSLQGYGAPPSLNLTGSHQWIGSVTFIPAQPCTGKPTPGQIDGPTLVCPNRPYNQRLINLGYVINLSYKWQYSNNGSTWSNYTGPGFDSTVIYDSITAPRWYRAIVKCLNSNLSDTTPVQFVDIAPFYYCYCNGSTATDTNGMDIGKVRVVASSSGINKLDNGLGTPITSNITANKKYTSFQFSVPPVVLYRDTSYWTQITKIHKSTAVTSGIAAVFIDYNRDGLFDTVTERVMNKAITNPLGTDSAAFVVPHSAEIGLTGLRVVLRDNGASEPCTGYTNGETEDYLAEIRYEPCSGPVAAGNVEGDTSMCVGYDYVVYDTTYEGRKSEINRTWQVSGDNILWFNAPNGINKDTLMRIFTGQPLYYRLRTDCVPSTDTTYSASMLVGPKAGYKCYCFSQAIGGKLLDTSDIGAYSLAGYVNNDGGSHLMNAKATHKRQDHTDESPILIDVDSMYEIKVFHTMRNDLHGDAKITIFMDFNNNHQYDIPDERVYTGYTAVGNFTLTDYLNVPKTTILNTPTGMRVILNNDIAPNIPSDEACGTYTSGETEDYIVKFIQPFPASVNELAGINHLSIYPNPTSGKFRLEFSGSRNVDKVTITILDVTGRKLKELNYQNNGNQFGTDIDLGNEAKGIYFVEVKAGNEKRVERVTVK